MNSSQYTRTTNYTSPQFPPIQNSQSKLNNSKNTNTAGESDKTQDTDKTQTKPSTPTNYRKESFSNVLSRTQAKSHIKSFNTAPSLAILISQGFTFEQILLAFKM